MTRLPEPDTAKAPESVHRLLEKLPDRPLFRQLARAETTFAPWVGLGGALLNQLELPAVTRELVILQVCVSADSKYEWVHHKEIAEAVGVRDEQIAAVAAGRLDAEPLAEVSAILAVVDELVQTHGTDDAGFETLRSSLGERQTVEVLLVIGFYLGHALFTRAIDLDLEPAAGVATQTTTRPVG